MSLTRPIPNSVSGAVTAALTGSVGGESALTLMDRYVTTDGTDPSTRAPDVGTQPTKTTEGSQDIEIQNQSIVLSTPSNGDRVDLIYPDAGADGDIDVCQTIPDGKSIRVMFRYEDDDNYWFYYAYRGASNLDGLGKLVGGTETVITSRTDLTDNTEAQVRVRFVGGDITVWRNGVEILSTTGQTELLDATSAGLAWQFASTGTNSAVRNLTFHDSSGTPANASMLFATTGAAETLTLPISGSVPNLEVDWGDGTVDAFTDATDPAVEHEYADAGSYLVTINGVCAMWSFNDGGDKANMECIRKWGRDFQATNLTKAFYGCTNMLLADLGGFSYAPTVADGAFRDCASMVHAELAGFDSLAVDNLNNFFFGCTALAAIDVSWVDFTTLTSISNFLRACSSLVSVDVTMWDVSNVTRVAGMFFGCTNLVTVDCSGWDTGSLEDATNFFRTCSSLNDIGGVDDWDVTSLTTAANMFNGAAVMSDAEADSILNNWEAQAVQDSVSMHFGGAQYTAAGSDARDALIADHSWALAGLTAA